MIEFTDTERYICMYEGQFYLVPRIEFLMTTPDNFNREEFDKFKMENFVNRRVDLLSNTRMYYSD